MFSIGTPCGFGSLLVSSNPIENKRFAKTCDASRDQLEKTKAQQATFG
jgi:hypothetical protein